MSREPSTVQDDRPTARYGIVPGHGRGHVLASPRPKAMLRIGSRPRCGGTAAR